MLKVARPDRLASLALLSLCYAHVARKRLHIYNAHGSSRSETVLKQSWVREAPAPNDGQCSAAALCAVACIRSGQVKVDHADSLVFPTDGHLVPARVPADLVDSARVHVLVQ